MSLPQLAVGNTCDYPTCLANGLTVAIAARPPLAYMARILIEPRAHSITHLNFEVRGGFLFQEKVLHFCMRRRASTRLLFLPQERYKRLQRYGHLLPASIIKTDCCRGGPPVLLQQGSQRPTSTLVSVTIPNIVKLRGIYWISRI